MSDEQPRVVSVVLPAELADAALRAANGAGVSRSELVRQLLLGYLHAAQNGDTNG
jgi:metal-responsive CopG/Arc/MetJ family transcriptional regulator